MNPTALFYTNWSLLIFFLIIYLCSAPHLYRPLTTISMPENIRPCDISLLFTFLSALCRFSNTYTLLMHFLHRYPRSSNINLLGPWHNVWCQNFPELLYTRTKKTWEIMLKSYCSYDLSEHSYYNYGTYSSNYNIFKEKFKHLFIQIYSSHRWY